MLIDIDKAEQIATSPSDIKVAIDIDDTLIDLLPAWVDWLNNHYGTNVDYKSITEWDMTKFFPTIPPNEVFAPLMDMLFWTTVKPKNGAVKYLKMLIKEGFDLYLCSATHYDTIGLKHNIVMRKFFPFFPWNNVIIAAHKHMIKCDVLVDDGLHNFNGVEAINVVFDAPHNQEYENPYYDTYRVHNWKELYILLHNLVGIE